MREIHQNPPYASSSRLSWSSASSSAGSSSVVAASEDGVDLPALPPHAGWDAVSTVYDREKIAYSTYAACLAALADPDRGEDEAFLEAVVDSYLDRKLASRDVKKAGKKVDALEKDLLHLSIPSLPLAIARARAWRGVPVTNTSLPSSWRSGGQGVAVKGRKGSTIVFCF